MYWLRFKVLILVLVNILKIEATRVGWRTSFEYNFMVKLFRVLRICGPFLHHFKWLWAVDEWILDRLEEVLLKVVVDFVEVIIDVQMAEVLHE